MQSLTLSFQKGIYSLTDEGHAPQALWYKIYASRFFNLRMSSLKAVGKLLWWRIPLLRQRGLELSLSLSSFCPSLVDLVLARTHSHTHAHIHTPTQRCIVRNEWMLAALVPWGINLYFIILPAEKMYMRSFRTLVDFHLHCPNVNLTRLKNFNACPNLPTVPITSTTRHPNFRAPFGFLRCLSCTAAHRLPLVLYDLSLEVDVHL